MSPDKNKTEKIEIELVKMLYSQGMLAVAGAGLVAVFVFIMMLNQISFLFSMIWFIAMAIMYALRIYIINRFNANPSQTLTEARKSSDLYTIHTFITGILWGVAGVLLFLYAEHDVYRAMLLVSCGLVGSSVITSASHPKSFYFFAAPTLIPVVLASSLKAEVVDLLLALMVGVFFIAMMVVVGHIHNMFRRELDLRFTNEELNESLKISEEKYRIVADYTYDWEYWIGDDGQMKYVSPSSYAITGYSPEEFITDPSLLMEIVHKDDQVEYISHMEIFQDTRPAHVVFRIIRKDGSIAWVEHACNPVYDDTGNWVGRRVSSRDITQKKLADERITKSEANLAKAQEMAHLGHWDWNIVTNDLFWSDEIYRIFGRKPQEFTATYPAFLDTIHPEDRDIVVQAVNDAVAGKLEYNIEHRIVLPNNNIKIVREEGEVTRDTDGKPVRMIGIVQDITERKLMEDSLKQREREFRTLAENFPDTIARYDDKCRFVYVNPRFEQILGVNADEIIGKMPTEVPELPEAHTFQKKILEVINTELPVKYEYPARVVGGQYRWFYVTMTPEIVSGGKVSYVQVVTYDITERKLYEQKLKEANDTKNSFFSIIAHDLRNPFIGIEGCANIIIKSIERNDKKILEEYAYRLRDATSDINNLLTNLLDWSRTQTDAIRFDPEEVNLNLLLAPTMALLMPAMREKNIEINVHIPDDITVYADTNMLTTVFRNLLSNAVKFSNDNGSIMIEAGKIADNIEISVEDHGVGISADRLPILFDLGTRSATLGTRLERGTGLGLILCKEFVERHGGRIWVKSIEGKGSKFSFILPNKA